MPRVPAIIEKGRNDAIYWIQWATKSLWETQIITTSLVTGWKTVQGIGAAIAIRGALHPGTGAVGATVTLVGFMGEILMPRITTEEYKFDLVEVLEHLEDRLVALNWAIGDLESEYAMKVGELEDAIYETHSYNLELYDLTRNDPHGDDPAPKETSYTAVIDDILKISQTCYEVSNLYYPLLTVIAGTVEADEHLTDKDGRALPTDLALREIRALLEDFLKTTCGRYLVAADQIKAAAEAYAQTDANRKAVFDRVMAEWRSAEIGTVDHTVEGYAGETRRSSRVKSIPPGSWNRSAEESAPPGTGDDGGYATD